MPGEGPLPTVLELIEPIEPSWIAGQLGVAWEADLDRFVIAVEELDTTALEHVRGGRRGRGRRRRAAARARALARSLARPRDDATARDPGPGPGLRRPRRRARRLRPSRVPVLRPADGPGGAPVPAHELTAPRTVHGPARRRRPAPARVRRGRDRGPHAVELERHLPRHPAVRRRRVPRRLQAGPGRASAVGLPERALPSGGGGLPPLGGVGLGARAAHPHPRGPARRGLVPAVHRSRLRAALLHALRATSRPPPPAAGHGRVRRPGQQHGPQERPRACWGPTTASGASTRACASPPTSSCAR